MSLDFSHYGGPSEDWLEIAKTLPQSSIDLNMDPSAIKKAYNEAREKQAAAEMVEFKPKLHIVDHSIETRDGSTIAARSYRSIEKKGSTNVPVLVFFHGGGYILGSVSGDDPACARIAIETGILVLNCEYRLTPEHTYPTAWYDSQDALAWLFGNIDSLGGDASKVIVGGNSAGGQLAASLVLEQHLGKSEVLKALPPIAGQLLMVALLVDPATYDQGPRKTSQSLVLCHQQGRPCLG